MMAEAHGRLTRLPTTAAIPAAAAAALHPEAEHPQYPRPSAAAPSPPPTSRPPPPALYTISCPALNLSHSHPTGPPKTSQTLARALSSSSTCPSSPGPPPPASAATPSCNRSCPSCFRFIHEDLRPWRAAGGVTRAMLGRARLTATFRLVVLGGRAYVQRLRPAFQTRDLFTIWGVLQLLRRYPGRVPDLDLMFDTVDWPVVRTHLYRGKYAGVMPPLFRYCGDDRNPSVSATRQELVKCNVSSTQDWNARIYAQDWFKESKAGYKDSDLGSQCSHRSLMPIQHYWPVRDDNKCASIKYAVDWGNSHKQLAQRIGKQASNFIQEELSMDQVYDYMLHLLTEYAKLLRFKPTKPPEAVEVCSESLACQAEGLEKKFLADSMVKSAHGADNLDAINNDTYITDISVIVRNKYAKTKNETRKLLKQWYSDAPMQRKVVPLLTEGRGRIQVSVLHYGSAMLICVDSRELQAVTSTRCSSSKVGSSHFFLKGKCRKKRESKGCHSQKSRETCV
ncbi:hypothetical protein C2845_PM16G14970 [Panicum miliaceum]|uniref:Glycosyl transferase CAP10 domain-containing protein n=1 Tax=Panicum miliaceum TaxID=4540 RepID=A0A3L6PYT8_PANMI|nr:hypothetical protein C2845_PM16G14970 [Panicum miliaceum]